MAYVIGFVIVASPIVAAVGTIVYCVWKANEERKAKANKLGGLR